MARLVNRAQHMMVSETVAWWVSAQGISSLQHMIHTKWKPTTNNRHQHQHWHETTVHSSLICDTGLRLRTPAAVAVVAGVAATVVDVTAADCCFDAWCVVRLDGLASDDNDDWRATCIADDDDDDTDGASCDCFSSDLDSTTGLSLASIDGVEANAKALFSAVSCSIYYIHSRVLFRAQMYMEMWVYQ